MEEGMGGLGQCCWGFGERRRGYKPDVMTVSPRPSPPPPATPIQTSRGHVPYLSGWPAGQEAGGELLARLPRAARPRGWLGSAGSPHGAALPVPRPGHRGQAGLASCGLRTGHSWERGQENRKGGSCWHGQG